MVSPDSGLTPVEGHGAVSDTRRVTAVVGVLSLAVFMSSLDLFIVNLAFPYISRAVPGHQPELAVLGAQRATRSCSRRCWCPRAGGPTGSGGGGCSSAGLAVFTVGSVLCGLAPGVGALIAARVVQAAGAGAMVPASLSLLLAAVPAPARPEGARHLVGPRRAGRGAGPGDRRRPGPGRLALGVLDQRAGRAGRRGAGGSGWCRRAGTRRRRPPRPARRGAARRGGRPGRAGAGQGAGLGLGLGRGSWACWPRRWCAGRSWCPLAAAPCPGHRAELLRSRTFSGAFAASILYYAGFGAFVLSSVEFLTGVWHYSAVEAGLAIAPGPLMVLPFARLVAPRLTALLGGPGPGRGARLLRQRPGAGAVAVADPGRRRAYVSHLLPAQLLGGAGVGLTIPSLLGAGSASLTPAQFGTGSGILNTGGRWGRCSAWPGWWRSWPGCRLPTRSRRSAAAWCWSIAFFAAAGVVSAVLLTRRPHGDDLKVVGRGDQGAVGGAVEPVKAAG